MKAAVVVQPAQTPQYTDFAEPVAGPGEVLLQVRAAALSQFTRGRAAGSHYSASGQWPAVAGADGVGVTADGRRVYFALPPAPFGAMAERTRAATAQLIEVPPGIDDVTAAAIANPGMSAWAALVYRAALQAGETVLIHGATGTAGRLAVQLAKYLGAGKVIATARNAEALHEVQTLGADVVIPFAVDGNPAGGKQFEAALLAEMGQAQAIDIVIDYLWGTTAEVLLTALAKGAEDGRPIRYVQVGSVGGQQISLPGAVLRSSALVLMGSGLKSMSWQALLQSVHSVYQAVAPAQLAIATRPLPLAAVEQHWHDTSSRTRTVFVVEP